MISNKFTRYADPKLQKTHEVLLESRKRFYAHSDATVVATMSGANLEAIQPIDLTVRRQSTADGDLYTFGYQLHEIQLRGVVVPDVRALCAELDRRLGEEITATLEQFVREKMPDLKQLLDKRRSDNVTLRIEIPR
jgi:hypothetical protein